MKIMTNNKIQNSKIKMQNLNLKCKIKKILLGSFLSLFIFSGASCAQSTDEKQPAENKPQTANHELVYLKVEGAIASSFDETPDWAPKPDPMAPVDGDMATRWSSGYRDGEWLYFDFGKPKTLSKIIIKWEQAYAPRYEILTSDDAKDWKRLILLEGQSGGMNEVVFQPVVSRYVKLLGLSRVNQDWGISIWEFEPYGPKDKNPDEAPLRETLKAKEKKTEVEEKREEIMKLTDHKIVSSPGPVSAQEFQRGVNYTSWDADELGTDISDYSLIYISRLGVGHIALMAVRYQDDAASNRIYPDPVKTVSDESLGHAINIIHALGMKVMLKPHVDLADEDARVNILPTEDWFKSYKEFILHYGKIAAKYNVELFCVGTELSNTTTTRWKDRWLDIIKEARKIYKGPLVYAANWDEYDTVPFWQHVDFIGIDAYFPLTKKNNPPKEELTNAWTEHADTIERWLKENKLTKPVIFTEIGYDTIEGANKQPWRVLPTLAKHVESQEEQANCLNSLLTVLSKRSWFKGLYWWNYFPRPEIGQLGYTLRGKSGEKILMEWYERLK